MIRRIVSLFVKTEQLAKLQSIAMVNHNTQGIIGEMNSAHATYLAKQLGDRKDQIVQRKKRIYDQLYALSKWKMTQSPGCTVWSPRPNTPDLSVKIATRDLRGCQLIDISLTEEEHEQFCFLARMDSKGFGAVVEDAYSYYINEQMQHLR